MLILVMCLIFLGLLMTPGPGDWMDKFLVPRALVKGDGCGWIRLGEKGYGIHWNNHPPLYSERNGYIKTVSLLGYRWRILGGKDRI